MKDSKKIPVQNQPIVRDEKNKALLFTDIDSVRAYQKKKEQMKSQKDTINRLEMEVEELKQLVAKLIEQQKR
jgi:hypothetical protein